MLSNYTQASRIRFATQAVTLGITDWVEIQSFMVIVAIGQLSIMPGSAGMFNRDD